jgi:aspartate/methionine/tyrosine aminotransferase
MANPGFADLPTTIFEEMSGLARAHQAVNLGQGFPDSPGPEFVRAKAAEAVMHGYNQYPPMAGLPELRRAVAGHYERSQGLELEWEREVTITSGATEALAASFLGLVGPGDEVLVFEPAYDSYLPMIRRAGGLPRPVALAPPDFRLSRAVLDAAFTPKTRMVVLNNPTNPTGAVLADEDLALLAEYCVAHDVVAVCDEVWEQVIFGGARHRPLIAYPGMRDRTVKIGSAGKMFGLTGWKVGWLCAAPALTRVLARTHQFLTFTTPPNLQAAVAFGLDEPGDWFTAMPRAMQASRDHLAARLRAEGFAVRDSGGTYFLIVDVPASGVAEPDRAFCLRAVKEAGVATIPISAFYETKPVASLVRLCFSKDARVLDEGVTRLARARELSIAAR